MKVVMVESEFVLKLQGSELEVIKECLNCCINRDLVSSKHTCKSIVDGIEELLTVDQNKIEILD